MKKVLITGISGSLRDGSYTRMAVKAALQGAAELGVYTQLLDLKKFDLTFCYGKDKDYDYPKGVLKLRQKVKKAQGIILGTPEYHGSFSGVIKNALDLMGFDEFEGKMIGLVGVSGGSMGASNALNSLRTVGRALHAWVIPEQVAIPKAWNKFDNKGIIKDKELKERVLEVGRQVARFSSLHNAEHSQEFMEAWEGAPINPGGS